MNARMQSHSRAFVIAGIVGATMAGLVVFAGCGDEPETQETALAPVGANEATAVVVTEQETCPIMGNPINPALFVEYEGKKVYFCCAGCPEKFLEDPETYVAKLPQFQE